MGNNRAKQIFKWITNHIRVSADNVKHKISWKNLKIKFTFKF